jgi:drug/metabolite transporter (DMT)-like permease
MLFLILCILSSTSIFVVFKSIDRFRIPSFPVIVINYLAASILGFVINTGGIDPGIIRNAEWLPISMIIGVLFIIMFFLIAYSSQKAGISVTTVASKMSVIFPIIFSLIIDPGDKLTFIKTAAIIATLGGVAMTIYKPWRKGTFDPAIIYIPLILFFGMGGVDSLVKFAQHRFVTDSDTALFSAILFLNAFLSGLVVLLFVPKHMRSFLRPVIWGWGLLLGAVNFGSIYFLVRALNHQPQTGTGIDSSAIFGINNIGIVALSVMLGLVIFRERLTPLNWVGIFLSALALLLFTLG